MKILAIETATEACSVALLYDGEVRERFEHQPQRQADLVLPMVDELMGEAGLRPAGLDAVAFGRGPGSFTGLRIAAAVTQGIAVAADLPVVPVSTLAVLAQGAYREHGAPAVLAVLDARMSEVYWGAYRLDGNGLMQLEGSECVVPPDEVPLPEEAEWLGAGSGWGAYPGELQSRLGDRVTGAEPGLWPRAADMLVPAGALFRAGETVPAGRAEPVYVRDKVARSIAERRAGGG